MKSKTSQLLFTYWNEVRNGRLAPRRFEIEPSRITPILPETFILERLDADTYRFRLAGTRICEDFGTELRGTNFLDGWSQDDHITLNRHLRAIAQQGGVGVVTFEAAAISGECATFECILLPLVHTRDTVDRFLGALSRVGSVEHQQAAGRFRRHLVGTEVIWPDGKPHSVVVSQHRQVPFLPHVRNARIVRVDRRQFRVYEGGLGKSTGDDV
ncbi:MAG: PAS domain-containing protein [Hyphomicrobiaceae bacterium]|nr:PAS domain-containing protein [Hyphomicrobiaceae bacterium]